MSKKSEAKVVDLSNLRPNPGSNHAPKRLGRGIGSGLGKTAGKGHKGQLARKGGKVAPGFEGGQTPLYRRLPKRGFTSANQEVVEIVNIDRLEACGLKKADPTALCEAGLIKSSLSTVKILGRGSLKNALEIHAHRASESARKAIETAGGKLVILKKGE